MAGAPVGEVISSSGYLILKASFVPRIIGVFMAIAGLCYIVNSFLSFVAPSLSSILLLLPVLLGEGGLTLWLLIVGVDSAKWESQAQGGRATDSSPAG